MGDTLAHIVCSLFSPFLRIATDMSFKVPTSPFVSLALYPPPPPFLVSLSCTCHLYVMFASTPSIHVFDAPFNPSNDVTTDEYKSPFLKIGPWVTDYLSKSSNSQSYHPRSSSSSFVVDPNTPNQHLSISIPSMSNGELNGTKISRWGIKCADFSYLIFSIYFNAP